MDYEDAWYTLKAWIADQDDYNDHGLREVVNEMDEIEKEKYATSQMGRIPT